MLPSFAAVSQSQAVVALMSEEDMYATWAACAVTEHAEGKCLSVICAVSKHRSRQAVCAGGQGAMLDLEGGAAAVEDDDQRATLQAIMSNNRASERFLALARDLDLMAPRTHDEVRPPPPAAAWFARPARRVRVRTHAPLWNARLDYCPACW